MQPVELRTSHSSQHPLFSSMDDSYAAGRRPQEQAPLDPQDTPASFSSLPLGPHPSAYPPEPKLNYDRGSYSNDRPGSGFARQQEEHGRGAEGQSVQDPYRSQERIPGHVASFFAAYNTPNQISFLSLLMVQTIAVLVMIGLIYGTINNATGDNSFSFAQSPKVESATTYLGLYIVAEAFELLVALDSLMQKNIVELALLIPFQIAILVYSSVLPAQLHAAIYDSSADTASVQHRVRVYAIVIPCIIGAVTVVMTALVMRLYAEFGWAVFKRIGADIGLKKMYTMYQIFVCLLKFDAFFFIGFSVQFLVLVTGTPTAEKVITIVAVPVILACLVLAAVAVRVESRVGVYAFFVLDAAGMTYFIYKLVRIFDPSSGDRYQVAKKSLTIFSVITFLMLLVTFVIAGLCMSNFGQGLRDNIPPYTWGVRRRGGVGRAEEEKNQGHGGQGLERTETRMSLD